MRAGARAPRRARARRPSRRIGGTVVKMTGDGVYAVVRRPARRGRAPTLRAAAGARRSRRRPPASRCACAAACTSASSSAATTTTSAAPVNRAARIMGAAHGGQVLVSQAVADARRATGCRRGVALRDLGAVRLRDLASPEHVYQVAASAAAAGFPGAALARSDAQQPAAAGHVVRRPRARARRGRASCCADTRLLTLLGIGGLGKTRLSLQVAADVMDDYPDGVWFVELAPLADPRLVPQAVASVLGRQGGGRAPGARGARRATSATGALLLILDNCEHLIARLRRARRRSCCRPRPRLKMLASSREPLHVAGETTLPGAVARGARIRAARLTLEALAQYEAVRLFVDRAVAAQPAFALTAQNAAGGRRHLPAPRRHSARARARRGARARAVGREDRRAPVRPLPAADRRRAGPRCRASRRCAR